MADHEHVEGTNSVKVPQPATAVSQATSKSAIESPKDVDSSSADSPAEPVAAHKQGPPTSRDAATSDRGRGRRGGSYINRQRFLTGGPERKKLTEKEIEAKLATAKEKNEAIMERRREVEKDEQSYSAITAEEKRIRAEKSKKAIADRKLQLALDEEREKSRARKLEKIGNRAWDQKTTGGDELWPTNDREYPFSERSGHTRGRGTAGPRRGAVPAGRGRDSSNAKSTEPKAAAISSKEEFPELGST